MLTSAQFSALTIGIRVTLDAGGTIKFPYKTKHKNWAGEVKFDKGRWGYRDGEYSFEPDGEEKVYSADYAVIEALLHDKVFNADFNIAYATQLLGDAGIDYSEVEDTIDPRDIKANKKWFLSCWNEYKRRHAQGDPYPYWKGMEPV